ncbi:class I SAM-dependent methyltransferase [Caulobacter sp. 17J80-11]|uniref:class I SAM-dependent DNA methyltransferase n=1 Tax=Caulobacter sp. 17J80-11 TaxID=2763502 RepID=UPI001653D52E|nr:class I SAM-dependent methyltransferase [Caulobacter sp. 17J80-11]MBC6981843.1 class I SAM-dependent methyltransferase [Caulobacter sp. 17J80-11]
MTPADTPTQFYGADIAYVHDAGFSDFARAAADEVLRRMPAEKAAVVDLGCAGGVLAERLSSRGLEVVGVDLSAPLLDLARRRAPDARFIQASAFEVDLPRAAAVCAIGEVINYQHDGADLGPDRLTAFFRKVHDALAPGGIFLFDAAAPLRVGKSVRRGWTEGEDWHVAFEVAEDRDADTLARRVVAFRRIEGVWRRTEETHRQRLWPRSFVVAALKEAGFTVEVLSGYGDLPFPGSLIGYCATKPV